MILVSTAIRQFFTLYPNESRANSSARKAVPAGIFERHRVVLDVYDRDAASKALRGYDFLVNLATRMS
jgi:hypothetical protein